MTRKYGIFWGILLCLFLAGCKEPLSYDPDWFKPDQSTCWPCQMYMMAFQAFATALEGSLKLICSNSFKVMTIALAFWLMYKVFPWVLSFSPPNFKEDFIGVIKVLFKAMIVSIFLTHPDLFYTEIGGKILQPIGAVFLKISELVLVMPNALGIETSQYARTQGTFLSALTSIVNGASAVIDWASALWSNSRIGQIVSDILSQGESAFSQTQLPNGHTLKMPSTDRMFGQLPMQIQSVIWQIYSNLWSGMGLVYQLLRTNTIAGFVGAIALGFALLQLMLFLPLSFIDAFMRLGIGIVLTPIFMTIWVFPLQVFKELSKKLIELILSAFFDILFNCIYVAFLISVLRVYVAEKVPFLLSTDFQASESGLRESGLHLSMDFLVMIVLILTIFKLSSKVDSITGQFFGAAGQGTSIKDTIKGMVKVAVATTVAVARVAASGGTDWAGFKKVGQEMGGMVMQGVADMNADQKKSAGEDLWTNET